MKISAYIPGTRAWAYRKEALLCARTVARVQEIVDGEIGPGRAEHVLKEHLDACRSCGHEAEVIRELKVAIARVAVDADPECVRKLEDLARRLSEGQDVPE